MEIRVRRAPSYIQHADRENHKYIAKVKTKNGEWRYFYDKDEYRRYLFGKKLKNKFGKLDDILEKKTSSLREKAKKKVDKILNKHKDTKLGGVTLLISKSAVDKAIAYVKNKLGIGKKITSEEKLGHKYIAKVKLPNGEYRYFYDQDEYNAYLRRQEYQKDEPWFMKRVPDMKDDEIYASDEDQAEINEKYSPYNPSRSMNCMSCTTAYELRRRGYDVEATDDSDGATFWDAANWYKDPKWSHVNDDGSQSDFTKYIKGDEAKKQEKWAKEHYQSYNGNYTGNEIKHAIESNNPPNSRGNIMVYWKGGGGHSMAYETDSNGKVTIRDCQTNKVVDVDQLATRVWDVNYMRTDNLELSKGVLETIDDN